MAPQPLILFLDFDGVLHPQEHQGATFSCRSHFWEILRACPTAEVVFSTSWREAHHFDQLLGFATGNGGEDLIHRFIGTTPVHPMAPESDYRHREMECLAWLAQNFGRWSMGQRPIHWLALDDIAAWFTASSPNLYLVNHQTGLTRDDVVKIIERLKFTLPM